MATEMTTRSSGKSLSMFKIFKPTEGKLRFLGQEMMDGYLNLPDEKRNWKTIRRILEYRFHPEAKDIFYEVGEFGGIIGFADIVLGHKCKLLMKLWNRRVWKKSTVREAQKLIKATMEQLQLQRLEAETSDERVKQMGEIIGFEIEGKKALDFRWNGEFFPTYIMSIVNINNKEDTNVF